MARLALIMFNNASPPFSAAGWSEDLVIEAWRMDAPSACKKAGLSTEELRGERRLTVSQCVYEVCVHQRDMGTRGICTPEGYGHQEDMYTRGICTPGGYVHQGDMCTRGYGHQGEYVHQGDMGTRGICTPGGYGHQGNMCTRGICVPGGYVY